MSIRIALPAEQRLHTGNSLRDEHHDNYLNGYSSSSQETSATSPSYTIGAIFSQFDSDINDSPTEVHANVSLSDSPAQLPFDDLIGSPRRPPSIPVAPPRRQDSLESPMAHLWLENQPYSTHKSESPILQAPQQQSTDIEQPHQRPEPTQTHKSKPDSRNLLGKISKMEVVDPYGESPFEAARRAQRQADRDAVKSPSPSGKSYANGRFPSIKPGEIMPSQFFRPTNGLPSFFPPSEAPPFPPPVHTPIRPAHFPPNLHPPLPTSEPARAPFHQHPPSQLVPQIPPSHSYHRTPSPSQPVPSVPRNPAPGHADGQPAWDLLRSHSQPVIPHSAPPQPTRSHSHQPALPPNALQHFNAPLPSRRHTLTPSDTVPPGLTPNGRYPIAQQPPSVPHPLPPPHHHPPGLPSQPQSQQHAPGPPSRSQSHYHPSNLPYPAPRSPHRQSLPTPPSQAMFVPRNSSPIRLPSQNVPTQQGNTPPMPRPDNSRPPRLTPKPVMPQLLAPLVEQEPNLARDGASQLQRSVSSAAIGGEKGGFLAKTKSILRKRTSATSIKTHGTISFSPTPTMPSLMEENGEESRKLGKRLSRKK